MLTVAKYMSPSGISIHGDGLEPSVPVARIDERDNERDDEAEQPDAVLEKALEVLAGGAELAAAA